MILRNANSGHQWIVDRACLAKTKDYDSPEELRQLIGDLLTIVSVLDGQVTIFKSALDAERLAYDSVQQSCATLLDRLNEEIAHHDACRDALDSATA